MPLLSTTSQVEFSPPVPASKITAKGSTFIVITWVAVALEARAYLGKPKRKTHKGATYNNHLFVISHLPPSMKPIKSNLIVSFCGLQVKEKYRFAAFLCFSMCKCAHPRKLQTPNSLILTGQTGPHDGPLALIWVIAQKTNLNLSRFTLSRSFKGLFLRSDLTVCSM
jgi:hypothetical protein